MSNCCGLMGKIFGHKFEKYEFTFGVSTETNDKDIILKYIELLKYKHQIRCKRCGTNAYEWI